MKKEAGEEGGRARTEADKLKAAGINASRTSLTMLEPEALLLVDDRDSPLFDERVNLPVDPESNLYRDILARGVEKPIDVRKDGQDRKGRPILQVIDGRQRVKILRHINENDSTGMKRKLPVNFVHGDDKDMVLRGLSSNLLRIDETPLSKAVKMSKAKSLGCSIEEIAFACNLKTPRVVEEHLLILSFTKEVRDAFNGTLPVGSIKTFAKVPRAEQKEVLARVQGGGAKKVRDVKKAIEKARDGETYSPPPKTPRAKGEDASLPSFAEIQAKIDTFAPPGAISGVAAGALAALLWATGQTDKMDPLAEPWAEAVTIFRSAPLKVAEAS